MFLRDKTSQRVKKKEFEVKVKTFFAVFFPSSIARGRGDAQLRRFPRERSASKHTIPKVQ